MKSRRTIGGILVGVSVVFLLLTGFGGCTTGNRADHVAIQGYDAVAYFNAGKALQGNASISFPWHGMTWYFSTKENRDLFAAGPEKYAPQYDGHCAWALTEALKAQSDPEVWKIVDGKLYLNCSRSAFEKWSRDIPGNIKKADANWLKLNAGK